MRIMPGGVWLHILQAGPEPQGSCLVLCCDSAFSLSQSHNWLDVCASYQSSDACLHCSQLDPWPLDQALVHGSSRYIFVEQMSSHKGELSQAVLPVGQMGPSSSGKVKPLWPPQIGITK